MKTIKKTLMIILSFTLIISSMTVSLAKEEIKEVEIASSLGLLKGDSDGITESYLSKSTTRLQAAIMTLRLKGLEKEAMEYSGSETFKDADEISWKYGKAILAYLKANPELGWIGSNNKFRPNELISAKAYYKVMLELLGYKQGEDFEWSNIISFAKSKGLEKIADVDELTNKYLAIATVEALEANNSEEVSFINELIEAKVIDAELAEQVGLYEPPILSEMMSANAVDCKTVKVDFDQIANIKAEDFKIVGMDSDEYIVNDIQIISDNNIVILKVEELEVGKIYSITYNQKSLDIVPIIKEEKTQPVIDSAAALTGKLIRAVFNTRNIRQDSLIATNFTISDGANIVDVKLDEEEMKKEGNHNKTIILLEVSNMKSGKAYTLKSDSVTSYTNNEAPFNTSNVVFAGKSLDEKAPKLQGANSVDGYMVEVFFEEDELLDEDTALNVANYTFTPELTIQDIKIKKNVLNGENIVVLTTDYQKTREIYKLKVENISDGNNVMKGSEETAFAGVEVHKNQVVEYAHSKTADSIEIGYKYESNDSAINIENYSIDNDIEVFSARFKKDSLNPDQLDRKKVILTTSKMKAGLAYKVKVGTEVQSTLGNGLKEPTSTVFAGQDPDEQFTKNISANAIDTFTVKVIFDEEVDNITATSIKNYKISDLGYPAKAVLSNDCKVVTLTVPKQKSGVAYTISMNDIKDLAGNSIESNTKVVFAGKDK
ncbi:Ig-like domain-containing protein [Vallitalea guaymasensis]|uniref:Ig-like domain-containing protein n=1 Tax=Vallitalea guaymasensis TaxID=1185412 RepID=UPI000DE378D6|nr:Ig-like domain-containing protein [Vallitalea guaymasensis]